MGRAVPGAGLGATTPASGSHVMMMTVMPSQVTLSPAVHYHGVTPSCCCALPWFTANVTSQTRVIVCEATLLGMPAYHEASC